MVPIRTNIEVEALRSHARLEVDGRVAARLLAITQCAAGMSCKAGDRGDALADAEGSVIRRFSAERTAGFADRPLSGRPPWRN